MVVKYYIKPFHNAYIVFVHAVRWCLESLNTGPEDDMESLNFVLRY